MDTSIPYGDSDYFYTLVEAMVGAGGVRNVSIRGSPYDFRFAPSSVYYGSWLAKMTSLVEETYLMNQNSRVTLLSHSMGCLYTLWFLNQKRGSVIGVLKKYLGCPLEWFFDAGEICVTPTR